MHNMTCCAPHFAADVQTGSTIHNFHATTEVATSEMEWSQNMFCVQQFHGVSH